MTLAIRRSAFRSIVFEFDGGNNIPTLRIDRGDHVLYAEVVRENVIAGGGVIVGLGGV